MTTYLLIYFALSAVIIGYIHFDRHKGFWHIMAAMLAATSTPLIAVADLFVRSWDWALDNAQLKTFWYYVFKPSRLARPHEELKLMHHITLQYRSTGSLRHRLWRLAERCYFRHNKYTP